MIDDEHVQRRFFETFPVFDSNASFRQTLVQNAAFAQVPAGFVIAEPGVECAQLALVLSGQVRVYKLAESGREITLYRIEQGETCVLTTSCILNASVFAALAITESPVEAVMLPAVFIRKWLDQYACWRSFVFALVTRRLDNLMTTIDEVAFRRMDLRIANWLNSAADTQGLISTTHQKISDDLGTSREVVSRILKDFEQRGAISLRRGEVQLLDPQRLRNMVHD